MNKDQIRLYVEKRMPLIGFGAFKLFIQTGKEMGNHIAEIDVGLYSMQLKLDISKTFKKLPLEEKINVLDHELIHGRFSMYTKQLEEQSGYIEENMINDIVNFSCESRKLLEVKK